MPDRSNEKTKKGLAYWEKNASKYDLSLRLISHPLPKMLELIGSAAENSGRILEVAAGTGLVTPTLAANAGTVVATDYSESMLRQLEAKLAKLELSNVVCEQADIYKLPYDLHSFDLVVAANVLHLVPDLQSALACLKAMLKPGGRLVLPTFCHSETRISRWMSRLLALTSFPGERRFTLTSLTESLANAGLATVYGEVLPGLIPIGYVEAELQ